MSLMQLFFPVATFALSVACFACWKTNKPLREKAKEEARAAAVKAAKEVAESREKDRRNNFRKELYSDIEQIIATPDMLLDHRYGSPFRGTSYRWKHLAEFILRVKNLQDQNSAIASLEKRLFEQSKTIHELTQQNREIQKALQLGQPVA
ncbi:hypothetical protein [Pseudomonas rubra]|uniref:Uncharacterized protein n=1 Tax=Pseudomonas rubra TaxID=2942627 RepID=A0ABT5P6G1_9PSED|nr:hypothetical protein [Pseudomonas rubra]MDD1013873.1 hypothetical protein [Pseudomonas rubra]MDD1038306.1 hypothetical protein [Pseudomonas rubra]MDD1154604.1 hypothetical protein [Pseudomonas rubra]